MSAAQAVAHDRYAHQAGIPERVLMENAARSLALITHRLYPTGRIAAVIGKGHNGGDVDIALDTLERWGRSVQRITNPNDDVHTAAVVLDGLLGTGSQGAPRGLVAELIRAVNASGVPVVAADLPSGVDATTGAVQEPAVTAAVTVTFGFPKLGMLRHPARAQCGRIICVEIGFPPITETEIEALLITPEFARKRLPVRKPAAHKGDSGRLLLLVGSHGMAGAAIISAQAAVHSGAGLVRIASSADNRELLQTAVPEATFFEREGTIDCGGITALVAGCGLGTDAEARSALDWLLAQTKGVPTLLDADALNLLAGDDAALRQLAQNRPLLLTPHPRELSRLLQVDVQQIVDDPLATARAYAHAMNAVVLLKGQPSVVAAANQPLLINTVGSSDVAVAGMGDQLSGVIGALLAAGLAPRDAAAVGLFYSGRAADLAARGRALSPRDVTDHLAAAFADAGPAESPLGLPFITFDQPERR
ncbi:MAG TPA: NAD(P)H-hydrate dehydratase [Longimicrobiales bacterium]|nr:NAD(P)H-hydrate dehydratase [Longimicrobiales bacterium]